MPRPCRGQDSLTTTLPCRAVRILVVDDEPDIVTSMSEGFRMVDPHIEVVGAESGDEAKVVLERDRAITAVICDIRMPGISGLALLAWMRASGHPASRFLMTAFEPQSFSQEEMADAAPEAVFTKPVNLRQIASLVLTR